MFGKFFGRKPAPRVAVAVATGRKRGRPTKQESVERRKVAIADMETRLKLRELEAKLAKAGADTNELELSIGDLSGINRQLRQIGMTIAPIGGRSGGDGGLLGSLRSLMDTEAARAAGQAVGAVAGAAFTGAVLPGMMPPPAPQLLPAGPPLPSPAAAAAEVPAPEPEPDAPLSATAQMVTSWVIGQLDGKSPAEAAEWVVNNPNPQIREFAEAIRRTPDEHLIELLGRMATQYPDLRGVADWLRSRPEWLAATARAIRSAATQQVA